MKNKNQTDKRQIKSTFGQIKGTFGQIKSTFGQMVNPYCSTQYFFKYKLQLSKSGASDPQKNNFPIYHMLLENQVGQF